MLKVLIGGVAVGIANIIPGVSGGTMMVVLGVFNKVMEAISGLFAPDNGKKKDYIVFLAVLGVGAIIGLVAFANMLEILFEVMPTQTMFCFVGMVVCSIPTLVRTEMKDERVQPIPLYIGCAVIFAISFLAPEQTEVVITNFPDISFLYLIVMLFVGIIAGAAMFMPGISGSMLLLIIGKYYLFKSLLANVVSFELNVLIPLCMMGIGILAGIVLSSKVTGYLLRTRHGLTMNFILGLVLASSLTLIPFDASYDSFVIISSLIAFAIGGFLVRTLEKLS